MQFYNSNNIYINNISFFSFNDFSSNIISSYNSKTMNKLFIDAHQNLIGLKFKKTPGYA